MVKRLSTMRETWVPSLDREDPLEKEMAIHPALLPGKSHGQRSLVGYTVHGVAKSQTCLCSFSSMPSPVVPFTDLLKLLVIFLLNNYGVFSVLHPLFYLCFSLGISD